MKHEDKQTLSQLMDGEWQDLNAAQSVESACADEELKATWSRYHLIRDVIRNDEISIDSSLTSRISQAIEDEPTYSNVSAISPQRSATSADSATASELAVPQRKSSHWRAGFGGAALAACVALATVVSLNVWQGSPDSGAGVQSVASTPTTIPTATVPGVELPQVEVPQLEYVSNKGTYWVTPEAERSPETESRLNALLSAHIERSPTAERSGMLPYSRLVGYDSVDSDEVAE